MPARLVPLNSGFTQAISLNRSVQLVGRHPGCDVHLDRPQISRRHCCLAIIDQQVVLRDLGSRHGCWVNGRQVTEAQLDIGDEIAIGHLIFRLDEGRPNPVDSSDGFALPDATPPPFAAQRSTMPPPSQYPAKPPASRQADSATSRVASPDKPNSADDDSPLAVDFGELNLGDLFRLREE